jgi:hypothetical protein
VRGPRAALLARLAAGLTGARLSDEEVAALGGWASRESRLFRLLVYRSLEVASARSGETRPSLRKLVAGLAPHLPPAV